MIIFFLDVMAGNLPRLMGQKTIKVLLLFIHD